MAQFPIPREEPTGPGYVNGSGNHGNGGGPPGSTMPERMTRVETELQGLKGLLYNVIPKVEHIGKGQERILERVKLTDNTLQRIAEKLEKTSEDTGQFRINIELQKSADALVKANEAAAVAKAEIARRDERTKYIVRAIIGAALAIMTGVTIFALTH